MFPWADTVARRYPPVAVWSVVGISLLAFLYQSGLPPRALNRFLFDFALVPSRVFGQLRLVAPSDWTPFLTNIFLHGGWLHLILNMWTRRRKEDRSWNNECSAVLHHFRRCRRKIGSRSAGRSAGDHELLGIPLMRYSTSSEEVLRAPD